MPPDHATTILPPRPARPPQTFSLPRANQALVLVRKVVADIVARYAELMDLRKERDEALGTPGEPERTQELGEQIGQRVAELNRLNRELLAIGCVLKDWRVGLVDFPAVRDGERVWLCWRLGEPAVGHWHGLEEGAAGRRPVNGEQFD